MNQHGTPGGMSLNTEPKRWRYVRVTSQHSQIRTISRWMRMHLEQLKKAWMSTCSRTVIFARSCPEWPEVNEIKHMRPTAA